MRVWLTANDSRVCSECRKLDGVAIKDDEEWPVAPGDMHPHCRCMEVYLPDDALVTTAFTPKTPKTWNDQTRDIAPYSESVFAGLLEEEAAETAGMIYLDSAVFDNNLLNNYARIYAK